MPNFTDYQIVVSTKVTVVAKESGRDVAKETFEVSAHGNATTGIGRALRTAIASVVSETAGKTVVHSEAVWQNENQRRGVS